jgi:signal transduction histidine kinase
MTTTSLSIAPPDAAARRRVVAWLGPVAAAVATLAAILVVNGATPHEAAGRAVLELLVVGSPLAAGLYAVRGGHDVRFGAALIGAGFAWSLTALGESQASVPYSIGRVAAWLVFPWLIYLMLAFPAGRVAGRLDRGLLVGLNMVLVVLYIGSALLVRDYPVSTPWAACQADCPDNAFMIVGREPALMQNVVRPVRELLAVLLFAAAAASMARRWRGATPLRRQAIAPVAVVSAVSVSLLAAFFVARAQSAESATAVTLGVLWSLCIPALAAAFLAGLLQRRLMLGSLVERLGALLGGNADVARLRDVLATVLRDPTLDLLVSDGPARWRDSRGEETDLTAAAADGRHATLIGANGVAEVALVHGGELPADDEVVRVVGALVLAGLRHERVRSRLAASLAQLDTSRRRIAGAADRERARIERDLHDGAQQRLIALRVRLTLVEEQLQRDPDAGAAALVAIGDEIERTLDELRSLAHGVYPSMLRDRGLAEALRGVAAQSPLAVRVQTFGLTRHSDDIDTAVYFTCLEALQNAVKHASGATRVRITLRQNSVLSVEVRDDGQGFDPRRAEEHGSGLRNMRDRIEAVGGTLTVESGPGRGTRILVYVPLD